ncbi:HAD family hydrolase [Candidatus Woesearchaeota archaeon]|nr:HAD family hydrolase [Candidatus Woesearchaeota archaeon]
MKYTLQHNVEMELNTIVLDLNGTLSVHGKIVEGVQSRISNLKNLGFKIILLTGDQRGTAKNIASDLGIEVLVAGTETQKEHAMKKFDKDTTVAIGNARIDIGMFRHAKLRIATLQGEGIHPKILTNVDIIVTSINDALDLLLKVDSLAATLKE